MENKSYPLNLLDAVAEEYHIRPKRITDDIMAGINYAVSILEPKKQKIVMFTFQDGLTAEKIGSKLSISTERVDELKTQAIYELRHPWVYKYMLYGIVGYFLHKSIAEFYNGYRLGYEDAKDGKESEAMHSHSTFDYNNTPSIECLQLSKATENCLLKAGIISICDCLVLREKDIHEIRGLGPKRADEVARALANSHIYSYKWQKFLFEPQKDSDWNSFNPDCK